MVSLTQELCPVAMRVAEGHNKMLSNVAERVTVPRNFIRGALLEQAGQDQNGDGSVAIQIHVYRFTVGGTGQDQSAVAGLDADLVGKLSGIFFTESPEQFEASTNGFTAADAIPVDNIPQLSGCGIDDLYLLVRTDADNKYASLLSALTE